MAYKVLRFRNIVIVSWSDPQPGDGPAVLRDAKDAFDHNRGPVIFMSVAPPNSPPPPEELRKYMGQHLDEIFRYCSSLHIVIEGSGFVQSAKRMAMATIVLISGRRKNLFVHNSLPAVRSELSSSDYETLCQAIHRAELEGVLPGERDMAALAR